MSPQARRRIVAASLALVAGVMLWHQHRHAAAPTDSAASHALRAVGTGKVSPGSSDESDSPIGYLPAPPWPDMIHSDSHRAASDWLARARADIQARYAKTYGAPNIRLMYLPPAEAWKALTARANTGDDGAAAAAVIIMMNCRAAKTIDSYPHWRLFENQQVRGLPAHWAAFILGVDAQLDRQRLAYAKSCKHIGGFMDFVTLMLDRFLQRNDPEVQLAEVDEIKNDEDAIAELRHLSAELGTEQVRRDLGERLIKAHDPAHQAEGLHLLESLANDDSYAMFLLTDCLRNGCGHFPGNPELAPAWVTRDAEQGEWFGLTWTIGDFEKQSDSVDALAWVLYRQDLTFAGCEQIGFEPSTLRLIPAIRDALKLQGSLSEEQQRKAEAITQAIENQWLAKAESAQYCAGD